MRHYKVAEVVEEISERVNDPANSKYDKFVGLEHYVSGDVVIKQYGSTENLESSMKAFRAGDILIARRNVYLRRASVVLFDGVTSGDSIVLRARNPILAKLLPFVFNTDGFWDFADKYSDGTMSKRLSPKTLMKYEFDLPNEEEQEKLANILWSLNDTREAYRLLLIQTDEMVKSQFIEMTQGAETTRLSDICCSYGRGKTPKYVTSSNVRVINQACIYWDHFKLQNVKYHNPELFKEENKLILGDVLLNSTGTGTIGRAIVFDIEDDNYYMTDSHVTILRPNNKKIHPVVLKYYFYDDNVQSELYRLCVFGSTSQAELSREALGRMRVPVIDSRKQEAFVEVVKQTDKSKLIDINNKKYRKIRRKPDVYRI